MEGGSKTILVIEDDPIIRETMKLMIESDGAAVLTADNGQEAIELLTHLKTLPCLIFLDLNMPVMDGWAFLAQRNAAIASIPTFIVSAALVDRQSFVGVTGFLTKPFEINRLLSVVDMHYSK